MRLPVISLWQPWGAWVIGGHKAIETRSHDKFRSLVGKRIAIHSTAKWDEDAFVRAMNHCDDARRLLTEKTEPGIIGTVRVKDVRWLHQLGDSKEALIDCFTVDRFGLILADIQPCALIPCRGKQGIWYFDFPEVSS